MRADEVMTSTIDPSTINEVGELIVTEKPDEIRWGRKNEWLKIGTYGKYNVPVWKYDWSAVEKFQKYPPAKLRELRAERGVGKRKKVNNA